MIIDRKKLNGPETDGPDFFLKKAPKSFEQFQKVAINFGPFSKSETN